MSDTSIITTTALGSGSFDDLQKIAKELSASGLMGKKEDATPAAVFGLMLLCQCDGLHPVQAMRRYHIIEGKPSMRADAMLADFFAKGGGVVWHVRSDDMVAGTFFQHAAKIDDAARERANNRFETVWNYESEPDPAKRSQFMLALAKLSHDGEETMLRTYADCEAKGITQGAHGTKTNWAKSPRQMLTARCITEGIRLVMPGLIAGIYEESEVRDFADSTQQSAPARENRDIEAMKAIVAEYRSKALDTTDPNEKSRLLGLASDLRMEIEKLEDAQKPAQKTLEAAPQPEKPAQAAETPPAATKTITVNVDSVEPPKKDKPKPAEKPKPTEAAPAAAAPTPPADDVDMSPDWLTDPLPTNWKDYRLRGIKSPKYYGKKLGEFAKDQIAMWMLWEKRGQPCLHHPDDMMKTEALFIQAAYKEVCK